MSCDNTNQSGFLEARDQIFLDTADGDRLDVVTGNLGLSRSAGLCLNNDDTWRYAAKVIALKKKNIVNSYRRVLEVCLGPQKSIIGSLSISALAGDPSIYVINAPDFLQKGTLILDPGLGVEETVDFCYRNNYTNEIVLETNLQYPHNPVALASSNLVSGISAGATTIPLIDSSDFPSSGPQYAIIIDQGTDNEELAVVTSNTVAFNTLTLLNPLTKDHSGAAAKYLRISTNAPTWPKYSILRFAEDATRNFPYKGWVRVNRGGITEEVAYYEENDLVNNVLIFHKPLQYGHNPNESVELVTPGAAVSTLSVIEKGTNWDIFQPEPRKVSIYIPYGLLPLKLNDASWMHIDTPNPFSTTLTQDATSGTTTLHVADVSGFPNEAGSIWVDISGGVILREGESNPTDVRLYDTTLLLFYYFVDENNLTIELPIPLGVTLTTGSSVTLATFPYAGTDLEEGNYRDSSGNIQFGRFPGPYVYSPTEYGPALLGNTYLSTALPNLARVVNSQVAGKTNIEVDDASLWPANPFDPFTVRIGESTGFQEDRTLTSRILRSEVAATVTSVTTNTLTYSIAAGTTFPQSDGVNPCGYRIIIDRNGANKEIIEVTINTPGVFPAGTFTFATDLAIIHSGGETVELVSDTLTFDVLTKAHPGPQVNPSKLGSPVQAYISTVAINDGTDFPATDGIVLANFGKSMLNVKSKITVKNSNTSYTLVDTSKFPISHYPYTVIFGLGTTHQETVFVTNNDTGTNTLTLAAPGTLFTQAADDFVDFISGLPEAVTYGSRTGNTLTLSEPLLLDSFHQIGETIIQSVGYSIPRTDGNSYAFKMPPDPSCCAGTLVDFIKTAGVQVEFITKK